MLSTALFSSSMIPSVAVRQATTVCPGTSTNRHFSAGTAQHGQRQRRCWINPRKHSPPSLRLRFICHVLNTPIVGSRVLLSYYACYYHASVDRIRSPIRFPLCPSLPQASNMIITGDLYRTSFADGPQDFRPWLRSTQTCLPS